MNRPRSLSIAVLAASIVLGSTAAVLGQSPLPAPSMVVAPSPVSGVLCPSMPVPSMEPGASAVPVESVPAMSPLPMPSMVLGASAMPGASMWPDPCASTEPMPSMPVIVPESPMASAAA